jgi:hypothetical protein
MTASADQQTKKEIPSLSNERLPPGEVQLRSLQDAPILNLDGISQFPTRSSCSPAFEPDKPQVAPPSGVHPWWLTIKSKLKTLRDTLGAPNDYAELLATKPFLKKEEFSRAVENLDDHYCLNQKDGPGSK